MSQFRSLEDLVRWLKEAPVGTQVDASELCEVLEALTASELWKEPGSTLEPVSELTWAEKIWVVPAERRLGTREVLEALGKGKTWLYERMSGDRGRDRFPHRKLEGELVFTAGEVRAWMRDQEEMICGGRMDSTQQERKGKLEVA